MAKTNAPRLDHFFSAVAARLDLWRDLARTAQAWAARPASRGDAALQAACSEALTALLPLEDFQAYPGARVLNAIKERVHGGDALGTARLVQRVSSALMSRSYRSDAGEFEPEDDASPERAMPATRTEGGARPYFEVLFVTPTPASRWAAHAQQIRKLRRPEDEFVYEPVFVGSFEDAALAVILNTNLESVVIYDGFPYESSRDVPLLKNLLSSRLSAELTDRAAGADGLTLAKLVKGFRPDLDIILLADRKPDAILADPASAGLRRVFYEVEEPLEIHFSILSGVAVRNDTPFFNNLKKYAQKPVGTFHALPVARGKSIFKSNWIRDMGEFYGANLFLAESSATSGGLDSLLEPTGNIKKAQLDLKAAGRLDKVKTVTLTNCTFDGHVYDVRRVMEECLAIKPDLIFLWDEAWFGFARWSPIYRPRTAMGARAALKEAFADPAYLERYLAQEKLLGADLDPKDARVLDTRLIPDPRKAKLRVYQTNSTHKSMSSLRQGSMVLVADEDYHRHEQAFKEAVFTHASTSPNQQIIASLDVARRQMELEGYEMVMQAIQLAIEIRVAVNTHPLVSKYFRVLDVEQMVPAEFRQSGLKSYTDGGATWADAARAFREDEFILDPTRLTLMCGTAGFDGTQFKGLLASEYEIQLNKTSRNSILLQTNINNTRSDVANLLKVLVEIAKGIDERLKSGGEAARAAFAARVKSLVEDVPDLPNFSHFHDRFRDDPKGTTLEGDMRTAFYMAYDHDGCEHIKLMSPEIDKRIASGPPLVSAHFVIPYPPGFPIMVPGQVIKADTIEFMRKLDVKEIHGYDATLGLKLISPGVLDGTS